MRCIDSAIEADTIQAVIRFGNVSDAERLLLERYPVEAIRVSVRTLIASGLLRPGSNGPPAVAGYWDSAGISPPSGQLSFLPLCEAAAALIPHALSTNNLFVTDQAPFLLVTTDDYLRPELAEVDRRSAPWLLVKPIGHTIWLGPLFIPGETVCWECLAKWVKPHRWAQAAFSGWGPEQFPPQPSTACLATTVGMAAGMITTIVAHYFAKGGYPDLENTVIAFDTRTLRQSRNVVRRWPDCPHCGLGYVAPRPTDLHSFVSPITSIVSSIEVSSERVGALFHAHATFAPPLPKGISRQLLRPQHAAGKAFTADEAEWKCAAEALERYSLIHRGDEKVHVATAEEVNALELESILLFSDSQYRNRDEWNHRHSELHWVPERLQPGSRIAWVEAQPLKPGGIARFVPAALCYMDYPSPDELRPCAADTNGCAAGSSLTHALLGAIFELVERDAVAIWWYNRLCRPQIDIQSLEDRRFLEFQDAFGAMGRKLYVLDVTTDLEIPSYVALAPKLDGSQPCFGAAAGLSSREAAFKAISEVAQICCWASVGAGSDELRSWIITTNANDHSYLLPSARVTAASDRNLSHADALEHCVRQLLRANLDPYYVDLTRAEVGLPVVRAIVPGLRHFWGRLGPGRLYSVPPAMGWLPVPFEENELNPVTCMI